MEVSSSPNINFPFAKLCARLQASSKSCGDIPLDYLQSTLDYAHLTKILSAKGKDGIARKPNPDGLSRSGGRDTEVSTSPKMDFFVRNNFWRGLWPTSE